VWLGEPEAARRLVAALADNAELTALRLAQPARDGGPVLVAVRAATIEAAALAVADAVAAHRLRVSAVQALPPIGQLLPGGAA
jgi:hypothetical protein